MEDYKCGHEKSKLGDNYCVVCGGKFDKKFSAQDLLDKLSILDRQISMMMSDCACGQTSYSRDGYDGMGQVQSLYKKWKQENFGL